MFLHRKANVVGIWWWWGSVVVTDRKLTLADSGHGYPTLASGHIPGTRHQLLSGDQSSPVPPTNISCFLTNCRITNGDTFCQGGFYWLYSLKTTFILVDQLFLACLFAISFILLSSSFQVQKFFAFGITIMSFSVKLLKRHHWSISWINYQLWTIYPEVN